MERARRATRIAALKLVWAAASLGVLFSVVTELTQPHRSPYTAIFGVAWLAMTAWIVREIRRLRRA